jgi:hypothetical protein
VIDEELAVVKIPVHIHGVLLGHQKKYISFLARKERDNNYPAQRLDRTCLEPTMFD